MQISAGEMKEEILKKYSKLLDHYPEMSVYIFGAARLGRNCADCCKRKGIRVLGFLDNGESLEGQIIDGIRVYGLKQYLENDDKSLIVIASLNYWHAIDSQLYNCGIKNFVHYSILHILDPQFFPSFNDGFDNPINELSGNYEKYQMLRTKLADERSRRVLDDLISFRRTLDISWTRHAYALSKPETYEQYFDFDIISLHDEEVFIDGGAYLGETSVSFLKALSIFGKKHKHIYLVEPDCELLASAQTQLSQYSDITYCAAGLSDSAGESRFDTTGDTGGAVNPEGNTELVLKTIDEITKGTATFIKLDIEGYEEKALLGASETIRNKKPQIAVSAYHKCGDLWKLYTIVNDIRDDYRIYLRHYTPGAFDTVLYFV